MITDNMKESAYLVKTIKDIATLLHKQRQPSFA